MRAAQSVQTFGRKKTAVAVAYCKRGSGLIKLNGAFSARPRSGPLGRPTLGSQRRGWDEPRSAAQEKQSVSRRGSRRALQPGAAQPADCDGCCDVVKWWECLPEEHQPQAARQL